MRQLTIKLNTIWIRDPSQINSAYLNETNVAANKQPEFQNKPMNRFKSGQPPNHFLSDIQDISSEGL